MVSLCWAAQVAPRSFFEEVFSGRIAKVRTSVDALHNLEDSQLKTTLLFSHFALPKVAFVL